MLKNNILVITLVLILSACSSGEKINGVDGSEIPPAFAQFPDVPFPEKAYIDIQETKALGSGENWIGSIVYTAPYNPSNLYDFYMSEMPKFKWLEVATVRARVSHMTYIRNNRAIQILIESSLGLKSVVTITAIPNENGIGNSL